MKKYNPTNLDSFKGKTFVTSHNSHYSITQEGKISGRPSIEGAELLYVAGFESKYFWSFARYLGNKEEFDKLILEVGEEPRLGLHLIVSLTQESFRKTRRNGLITSAIVHIE